MRIAVSFQPFILIFCHLTVNALISKTYPLPLRRLYASFLLRKKKKNRNVETQGMVDVTSKKLSLCGLQTLQSRSQNAEVNIDVDKISYLVSLMLFIKYHRNTNIIIVCKTALLELLHSKSNILE